MLHLSDTERKTLCAAAGHHHPGVTCLLPAAVEAILTARLAVIEAERDSAQEHLAYHLRDFHPGADMKATGDLAVDMAAYATRLKARCDDLTARLARVEALADEWERNGLGPHNRLRAALAAPTPTEVQP